MKETPSTRPLRALATSISLKPEDGEKQHLDIKTVQGHAADLASILFGVSMRDLRRDPALREFIRKKLDGEA